MRVNEKKIVCSNCAYWEPAPGVESEPGKSAGTCHRYPPKTQAMPRPTKMIGPQGVPFVLASIYPTTGADEFCGEYSEEFSTRGLIE